MANLRTIIQIEGLNELRLAMQKLPEQLQSKVLSRAVAKGALLIRNEAKDRAPTGDTRLLKRRISSTRGKRRATEAAAFVRVRMLSEKAIEKLKKAAGGKKPKTPFDPYYWRFLEFGTSKMQARPFIRPAFNAKKEAAAEAIKEDLRKGIEEVAKTLPGKRF